MIRRVLGLGAAACLLAGTTAGGASAAAASGAGTAVASGIWQVVPSENPQPHLLPGCAASGYPAPVRRRGLTADVSPPAS